MYQNNYLHFLNKKATVKITVAILNYFLPLQSFLLLRI